MTKENAKLEVIGHVLIKDAVTGEVIVDKFNAIHYENASVAIAESLARISTGPIQSMVFGNGGATTSGVGTVTYLTPNTVGVSAQLYNQTYSKIVNSQDPNNLDPIKNKIAVSHVNGNVFSDIIISCVLETGEPAGQNAFDNTTNMNSAYVFNEIGLKTYGDTLFSHVIFSPVEKSSNRSFVITYTVRFQLI